MAAPMTYRVGEVQYIAVMAGYGGGPGLYAPFPPATAAYKYGNDGRIVAFRLGGSDVPKPLAVGDTPFGEPPSREGTPQDVVHGQILYNRFCSRCHSMGRGELPDLRKLSSATHAIFYEIVLKGAYVQNGMGRFDDVLSRRDAEDLHAFLVYEDWMAYMRQQSSH